jgi:hypothetical protein
MLGRNDIIFDHARAYWHEAGHVLVARKLDVPVAGVIYTNLKRLPDKRCQASASHVSKSHGAGHKGCLHL